MAESELESSIQRDPPFEYWTTDQTETDRQKVVQGNMWKWDEEGQHV